MNQPLTDRDIHDAFATRVAGSPAPDLRERIHAAVATTPQRRGALAGLRGANPFVGRLAFAALVSVTTVALVGGLLIAGSQRDPSTPPVDSPTPSQPTPTQPTPDGSPPPGPVVTPPPGIPTLIVDQTGRIIDVDGAPLFERASAGAPIVATLPDGAEIFVIEGPTVVDGTRWFRVVTLNDESHGWLAESAAIEATTADCHTDTGWTPDRIAGLGRYLSIACFGDREIEITGMLDCREMDVVRVVTGPAFLEDTRFCAFWDESGEPYFEVYGMPWDELPPTWNDEPMTVTGHFDDVASQECRSVGSEIGPRSDEDAVLFCRGFFHFDAIRPAG